MAVHITDTEFKESADNRERLYEQELLRAPIEASNEKERTFMDRLGRGRWPVDYYTARAAGLNHADAMQRERWEIRNAAGLPQTEPKPEYPKPPDPPKPDPPSDVPGVKDDAERVCSAYLQRTRLTGFKPNENSTRESRVAFLREVVLEWRSNGGGDHFVMKRASETRPISDEVIVFIGSATHPIDDKDYRRFWDIIKNAGTPAWEVNAAGHGEILHTDQPLVDPVTLEIMPG